MAVDILHTRNLFLRSMCAVYMFAFGSLYFQIPGLYGETGILPAHVQLNHLRFPKECFHQHKTLLCFATYLHLNVSYAMELLALVGTVLSFIGLVWKSWCSTVFFLLLWSFYLSLYQVGQTFLWFQWDILLLEVGFLTIFVAPLTWQSWSKYRPRNLITMWMIRWALFRLMFASGVVKLQSRCPTWWSLTALTYHHEAQCIPSPLAWYLHHLPEWMQKFGVVGTYVIEIPIPFFFFSPIRSHRSFAFYSQVLLQVLIILSGNYNFFNLLTIVMCLSLVDDVHLGYKQVRDLSFGFIAYMKNLTSWVLNWVGLAALAFLTIAYFNITLNPKGGISSKINFTEQEFDAYMAKAVPFSIAVGALCLLITIAEALTSSLLEVHGYMKKLSVFSTTFAYSIIALVMFGLSLVPYSTLDRGTQQSVWPVFRDWYKKTSDLQLTSSYGLFRRMTGVGGRPEVILEGADRIDGPWKEYEFLYKPGALDRMPPIVIPHQPRLDWQMWFAALGTYDQNPWLISLAHRLLVGEPHVLQLLSPTSPWKAKPPKYIRGVKYLYHYSKPYSAGHQWWTRDSVESYMPVYTVDHAPLVEYLRKTLLIGEKDLLVSNLLLSQILEKARSYMCVLPAEHFLWSLFFSALLLIWTRSKGFI